MKKLIIVITTVLWMSGCASIISGTKQQIVFNSEPSEATVYLKKKNKPEIAIGKTPLSTEINRKTRNVIFRKEGYYDNNYKIDGNINLWYFGNLILGGIPGMTVDLLTGAYIKLEPSVSVELNKK
jgi:hypothetical protein